MDERAGAPRPAFDRGAAWWFDAHSEFNLSRSALPTSAHFHPACWLVINGTGGFVGSARAPLHRSADDAALLTVRMRPLFWLFVVAFNLVGAADIFIDYYHGIQLDLPALSATYWIPIIYVPALMITHFAAFYLLARSQPEPVLSLTGDAAAY